MGASCLGASCPAFLTITSENIPYGQTTRSSGIVFVSLRNKEFQKNLYIYINIYIIYHHLYYDIVIRFTLRDTGRPSIIEFSYHRGRPTEGEW